MSLFVHRLKDVSVVTLSLISVLLGTAYGWISLQLLRGFFSPAIGNVHFGSWQAFSNTSAGERLQVMILIIHLGMVWLLIRGIPRTLYQWRYRDYNY